jgi:hypothetical protein
MAKASKVQIETTHHEDGSFVHHLTFSNGQKRSVAFGPDHALTQQFASYGAKTKLLNAVNATDDTDKAVEKVDALCDAFDDGKWSTQGEGTSKYSPLVQALAELKGIDVANSEKLVKGMSKATQAKLRNTERVATIIARIKGAEGKAEGDDVLDDLLKENDSDEKRAA